MTGILYFVKANCATRSNINTFCAAITYRRRPYTCNCYSVKASAKRLIRLWRRMRRIDGGVRVHEREESQQCNTCTLLLVSPGALTSMKTLMPLELVSSLAFHDSSRPRNGSKRSVRRHHLPRADLWGRLRRHRLPRAQRMDTPMEKSSLHRKMLVLKNLSRD